MNTKPIPAILALIAGFVTCVISFVQHVDTVVFARKFVLVCIIFFAIGMVIHILIQINFKQATSDEDEELEEGEESESEDEDGQDGQENVQEADEDEE